MVTSLILSGEFDSLRGARSFFSIAFLVVVAGAPSGPAVPSIWTGGGRFLRVSRHLAVGERRPTRQLRKEYLENENSTRQIRVVALVSLKTGTVVFFLFYVETRHKH